MSKNREYLTSVHPLKFNGTQIKINSKNIILTKKSHVRGVILVTNYVADFTSCRGVTRKKLSPKEKYVAQGASATAIASICQAEAYVDLFWLLKQSNFCSMILQS